MFGPHFILWLSVCINKESWKMNYHCLGGQETWGPSHVLPMTTVTTMSKVKDFCAFDDVLSTVYQQALVYLKGAIRCTDPQGTLRSAMVSVAFSQLVVHIGTRQFPPLGMSLLASGHWLSLVCLHSP